MSFRFTVVTTVRVDTHENIVVRDFSSSSNCSVFLSRTAIVYRFLTYAAKSNIPGANYGAFIVFKGAWKLKEDSLARNKELLPELEPYEAKTKTPLEAVFKKGQSAVTVYLKGENLHGNRNRLYWPRGARKKLKAVVPTEAMASSSVFAEDRKQIVRVVGEHLEIPIHEGKCSFCSCAAWEELIPTLFLTLFSACTRTENQFRLQRIL